MMYIDFQQSRIIILNLKYTFERDEQDKYEKENGGKNTICCASF